MQAQQPVGVEDGPKGQVSLGLSSAVPSVIGWLPAHCNMQAQACNCGNCRLPEPAAAAAAAERASSHISIRNAHVDLANMP